MNNRHSTALAIIGACRLAEHLAAIEALGGVRLLQAAEALGDPAVRGVVVCAPLRERAHWIRQAAAAGKHVLCAFPPAATFQRLRELVDCCGAAGVELAAFAEALFSPLAAQARQALGQNLLGAPLFFELRVSLPQSWIKDTREGLLLFCGPAYFSLIHEYFGALDSVYARARSLGLNRPEEDVVVAQLRFRNGVEGSVHLNGLGGQGRVVLQIWGERAAREFAADLPLDLRPQYRDFLAAIETGRAPALSGARLLESLKWVEWFRQAARFDREVFAHEVCLG